MDRWRLAPCRSPSFLSENVDWARPDLVPVLLSYADIECVVAARLQPQPPRQGRAHVPVLVGQPEDPHAAPQPTAIEDLVLGADLGQLDLGVDVRRGDPEHTRPRVGEPCVEAAESARRQRLPPELARRRLVQPLVQIPEIDRCRPFEPIAFERRRTVPDRLPAAATHLGPFPDHANPAPDLVPPIGPPSLHPLQAVPDPYPPDPPP